MKRQNSGTLHIVFGSQGAGKSTYARKLAGEINGVHFAIDDWMWQLFGPDMPQELSWILERVGRCEQRIWATACQVLQRGGAVVLDLGFLKEKDRKKFVELAANEGISAQLHYVDAPLATRQKRVRERNGQKGETFSFVVSPAMFDRMEKEFEGPTETELQEAILMETA